MKIKDYIILMAASLFLGWLFASFHQPTHQTITKTQDTLPKVVDTVVSVRGKKALFIGDSHTAADYGWQHQVCKKTGMSYLNTAVGGKQTGWMLEQAKQKVTEYFDYCFVFYDLFAQLLLHPYFSGLVQQSRQPASHRNAGELWNLR